MMIALIAIDHPPMLFACSETIEYSSGQHKAVVEAIY